MRVLAMEPYYGGSHRAFFDGWVRRSRHDWTTLTLPAHKWKWRMRHAAMTFADEAAALADKGGRWDVVFCSDMLNLAEFKGLAPSAVRDLPAVVYFHENQLTYPVQLESERDYQFSMTNITTALAADEVWFNSGFHRDEFLGAAETFLRRMPDYQPINALGLIRRKSHVHPPGAEISAVRSERKVGPVHILWAARWEHDKNPEDFFAALRTLKARGVDFRLSVIGQQFRDLPPAFEQAREYFADHIERWGYQQSRSDYENALAAADVFVSAANHEFFGISAVEAIMAGCYPLLPDRLAYPEIVEGDGEYLYDGSPADLARRLQELDRCRSRGGLAPAESLAGRADSLRWPARSAAMDAALAAAVGAE